MKRTRREFLALPPLVVGALSAAEISKPAGYITDVEGLKVGHFTETRRPTGCTVIIAEEGAVAGVDVRGSGPGTRETDLLNPINTVEKVHAVALSGGSAFGLATADGVMKFLEEKKIGFAVGPVIVPIVPAAILFDLRLGDGSIRPTAESGYKAAQAARGGPVEQGNVGAGAGATVGKMLGPGRAMKGGLGTASIRLPNGLVVGAIVAVNAVGDVYDYGSGKILAGARTADGKGLADTMALLRRGRLPALEAKPESTTIGAVATNAALTKAQAAKVTQMAHDGLARAIQPVHTALDGDTIFALATGRLNMKADAALASLIGALAADVMAQAVVSAILHAKSIPGYPAYADFAAAGADSQH